jgi:hypothetical protein
MTCLWPLPDEERMPNDWATLPDDAKVCGRTYASRSLEFLTGYQVGVCPVKLRPALACTHAASRDPFMHAGGAYGFYPVNFGGTWTNNGCGCRRGICEVPLPEPVGPVSEVKVDGVVIVPTDYVVHNRRYLVWQGGGECPFPVDQDMSLPDTSVGTMSVTYLNAYEPDPSGVQAAAVLAVEFAKACAGKQCKLPPGVTNITRQGINLQIPASTLRDGLTGLREVDTFVGRWNPNNIMPTQVWSPDLPQHRIVTGG